LPYRRLRRLCRRSGVSESGRQAQERFTVSAVGSGAGQATIGGSGTGRCRGSMPPRAGLCEFLPFPRRGRSSRFPEGRSTVSFLHIADKNDEGSIVKNGISSAKRKAGPRGVYAVPAVPSYATTHQWAREIKRSGVRTLICMQFRIPDDEFVLVGRYDGEKLEMAADEAAGTFLKHTDPMD
jgi:hypothetical protein